MSYFTFDKFDPETVNGDQDYDSRFFCNMR